MIRENLEDYLSVLAGYRRLVREGHKGAIVSLGGRRRAVRAIAATGIAQDATVVPEAIVGIFTPSSDTHDLGVVILEGAILAAHCQFPLPKFDPAWGEETKRLGSRHRAAMGMSLATGAEVLVLSEETGSIRVARGGKLIPLDIEHG